MCKLGPEFCNWGTKQKQRKNKKMASTDLFQRVFFSSKCKTQNTCTCVHN